VAVDRGLLEPPSLPGLRRAHATHPRAVSFDAPVKVPTSTR